MARLEFKASGDLSDTMRYLQKVSNTSLAKTLSKSGTEGVTALKRNTPVKTGKTAASWEYDVTTTAEGIALVWNNTNVQDGIPVVQLLENGHVDRSGKWVNARPFVKQTMDDLEMQIVSDVWKEVNS